MTLRPSKRSITRASRIRLRLLIQHVQGALSRLLPGLLLIWVQNPTLTYIDLLCEVLLAVPMPDLLVWGHPPPASPWLPDGWWHRANPRGNIPSSAVMEHHGVIEALHEVFIRAFRMNSYWHASVFIRYLYQSAADTCSRDTAPSLFTKPWLSCDPCASLWPRLL